MHIFCFFPRVRQKDYTMNVWYMVNLAEQKEWKRETTKLKQLLSKGHKMHALIANLCLFLFFGVMLAMPFFPSNSLQKAFSQNAEQFFLAAAKINT